MYEGSYYNNMRLLLLTHFTLYYVELYIFSYKIAQITVGTGFKGRTNILPLYYLKVRTLYVKLILRNIFLVYYIIISHILHTSHIFLYFKCREVSNQRLNYR